MSLLDVVAAMEEAYGRRIRRIHVPEPVPAGGARVLRRFRPEMASVMGLALASERTVRTWDDAPFRQRGISGRTTRDAIAEMAVAD